MPARTTERKENNEIEMSKEKGKKEGGERQRIEKLIVFLMSEQLKNQKSHIGMMPFSRKQFVFNGIFDDDLNKS